MRIEDTLLQSSNADNFTLNNREYFTFIVIRQITLPSTPSRYYCGSHNWRSEGPLDWYET